MNNLKTTFFLKFLFLLLPNILVVQKVHSQQVGVLSEPVCLGAVSTLSAITDIPVNNIINYSWDLDNDGYFNDANGKTVSFTFPNHGIFEINLLIKTNDGKEYKTQNSQIVTIYPIPRADFYSTNFCYSYATNFYNQSNIHNNSKLSFTWDFDNDGITDSEDRNPKFIFNTVGIHSVKLNVVSENSCSVSKIEDIEIFPSPNANFEFEKACANDSAYFKNTSTVSEGTFEMFIWNLDGLSQFFSSNDVKHRYNEAGLYDVELIALSDNACSDTIVKTIVIEAIPEFSLYFDGDTSFYQGKSLTVSVNENFDSYNWSTGQNSSTITVSEQGTYSVMVTDANKCKNSKTFNVIVKDFSTTIVINKILSPNDDGINDYLEIEDIERFNNCSLKIYNTRGTLLYNSSNYTNNWNAFYKNKPLEPGTYYYYLKCDGFEKRSSINVIR